MNTHHPTTCSLRAALLLGLLSFAISAATAAQAGIQLFEGSWSVKSFGNECRDATDPTPGPYCGNGYSESEFYSAFGIPQGIQCNPNQPRCPFASTPTNGTGLFAPLGGSRDMALFCAPWSNWQSNGTTARPAKGGTAYHSYMRGSKIPPLYRNPAFFTSGGQPNTTSCTATSTGATPGGKGLVQAGKPITGVWNATTTGTQRGGFRFGAAPPGGVAGIRTTGRVGEFNAVGPYVYSYTYATLRNQTGLFGPGSGPGSFSLDRKNDRIHVKQGTAKFGGTMTMLGNLTNKACYYRNGGCSLGENNWRYDAIGTSGSTYGGVFTPGYIFTYIGRYYHTALMLTSTINVYGSRMPWTTGSATFTARGRGPHKTVHYAHGYDNRNTTTPTGKGTIQMVSPVITRWLQPGLNYETGGIGILQIKFIPEPQTWVMLVAGASLLGLGTRMRGR